MRSNVVVGRGRAGFRLTVFLVGAVALGGGISAHAGNLFLIAYVCLGSKSISLSATLVLVNLSFFS